MSSEMLREVSDSLFEFLSEAFPTDRSYSRADIEQDPMPPLMAHFLGHTLQHKLDVEVEHLRTIRSSWFDYDHPDVQHTYKAFIAALAQNSRIPAEEWRGTLKRATKLVIAHLILPTHTLVEFVFRDDEGPLLAPVVYRQLSYFAAYPYLREAVETFLQKRELKEIDRTRFSSLLTQIDRHMTANYTADEWLRMLRPLFDLMRRVPKARNQGVPIDLLSMFFGDKEAYEIQERLQVEKEVHRVSSINEESLRRVIEGSVGPFEQQLTQKPLPKEPPSQPTPPPAPQKPAPDDTIIARGPLDDATVQLPYTHEPASQKPAPEPVENLKPETREPAKDTDNPRPLWERFQKPKEAPEIPVPTNGDQPAASPAADDAVPLWMRFQKSDAKSPAGNSSADAPSAPAARNKPVSPPPPASQPAPPPPKPHLTNLPASPPPPPSPPSFTRPVEPLHTPAAPASPLPRLDQLEQEVLGMRGSGNRSLFVENLFSGSTQDYEQFLSQLQHIPDWSRASKVILEEVFKKHKVNIYSPAAIMFTESVEEQFRQN